MFAHSFSRPVRHLGVNVVGVLIIGNITEREFGTTNSIALFVAGSFLDFVVTAIFSPESLPTLGVSVGLYVYISVVFVYKSTYYLSRIRYQEVELTVSWPPLNCIITIVVPPSDFSPIVITTLGVLPSFYTATISHVTGVVIGILF